MSKIRLRLVADIDVDPDAWMLEYGRPALPIDAEDYVVSLLMRCPAAESSALSVNRLSIQKITS